MIRVLVAEDSAVTREYLMHLLGQDPMLQVVGSAQNGLEAVAQTEQLSPDVVLMDVYMPRMNGYEATREIMERFPTPIVMMSSVLSHDEVAMTFEVLKAGALAVLDKPAGLSHPDSARTTLRLQETIRLMAGIKVIHRWPRRNSLGRPPMPPSSVVSAIQLVAIGASTGGPTVIAEILGDLPRNLPVPILVVQHIAPGFTSGLVEWIGRSATLHVKLAESGETARPGTVYVAPHGFQMGITKSMRIHLTQGAEGNSFCPSISYLFQSVAESIGPSAAGVLLTGMGQDGAKGLLQLRRTGGVTIAQDEDTSVIFGMPGEAVRIGAAQYVLSPGQIAELLRGLV